MHVNLGFTKDKKSTSLSVHTHPQVIFPRKYYFKFSVVGEKKLNENQY